MGSSSNIYQRLTHQMRTAQDTGSEQWRLLAVLLRQGWYLVNKGLGHFYSTPPHREKALHVVVVVGVLLQLPKQKRHPASKTVKLTYLKPLGGVPPPPLTLHFPLGPLLPQLLRRCKHPVLKNRFAGSEDSVFLQPGVPVNEPPVCTGTPKTCSEKAPVTAHGAPTPEVCLETKQLMGKQLH